MFSFLSKKKENKSEVVKELKAIVSGRVIPIEEVNDGVFSSKVLGDGIGIEPQKGLIVAPCDGEVTTVMKDSKHAVGMTLNNGAEILLHVGLETVNMNGEGFELFVKEGQSVKAGDSLIEFSRELIQQQGYKTICIFVVTNSDKFPNIKFVTNIDAIQNETVVVEFDSI